MNGTYEETRYKSVGLSEAWQVELAPPHDGIYECNKMFSHNNVLRCLTYVLDIRDLINKKYIFNNVKYQI